MASPSQTPTNTSTFRCTAGRIAYTDAGEGSPVVLLHGNPTNARLYRYVIPRLARTHRCIAPDYIGFGRSDAPTSFSYRPPAHATVVESLLERLNLDDITLVLHDWGGPIGLSYALRHPGVVRRLVLINTWGWPLQNRPLVRWASRLLGSSVGRWAIEEANLFTRLVMPATLARPRLPRPQWIQAYAAHLDSRVRRRACWAFARALIAETPWLRALWSHRARLYNRPAFLLWGMRDPAFGTETTLQRWHSLFPDATVRRYPNVGHYVPEEVGPDLATQIRSFLDRTSP